MNIYNNLPLFVEKRVSQKDDKRTYICLYAKTSYRDIVLSYDVSFICELLGCSIVDLNNTLNTIDLKLGVGKICPQPSYLHGVGFNPDKEPVKSSK